MPVSASIDTERGIVTLQFTGDTSFLEWKATMDGVFQNAEYLSGMCILSDRRLAEDIPSTDDIRRSVSYLVSHAAKFERCGIAIVISSAVEYGMSRMLELMVEGTGVRLRAFYSPEEALAWLGAS